jgi:hypothetical protein
MTSDAGGRLAILINDHWNAWKRLRVYHYSCISEYVEFKRFAIFMETCAFNHLALVFRLIGFDGILLQLLADEGLLGCCFALIHRGSSERVQVSKY